jgi:hypothetical protein
MAAIVTEYENGIVAPDFTPRALAKLLNALTTEKIRSFKSNSGRAASVLNAGSNEKVFHKLINQLQH